MMYRKRCFLVKLSMDKAIVTKKYTNEKTGKTFLTLTDGENELNISSGDLDLSQTPVLEPVKLDATIKAYIYEKRLNLIFLTLNLARIEVK